jgi:hypothetical protein
MSIAVWTAVIAAWTAGAFVPNAGATTLAKAAVILAIFTGLVSVLFNSAMEVVTAPDTPVAYVETCAATSGLTAPVATKACVTTTATDAASPTAFKAVTKLDGVVVPQPVKSRTQTRKHETSDFIIV